MATMVIFETHSTTEDSEAGIATGWLPGRLSATGRGQAAALGRRRRADGLAAVYSSDLARAVETAEIAFAGSGIPIHHDSRLRECNYGELNGGDAKAVAAERAGSIETPFPGGQSLQQVVEQVRSLLAELAVSCDSGRVLLIGHSATRMALDCLLHGATLSDLVTRPIAWQPGWEYPLTTSMLDAGSTGRSYPAPEHAR